MISKNFFESLEQIAYDRGLELKDVLAKVEVAMGIACKNSDVPYKGIVKIDADYDKKKIRFFDVLTVVEEVDPEGPRGQITLEEALENHKRVKVGSEIREEINLSVFGRKAASLFRQNLLNELTSLEREDAYNMFSDKIGEIITGRVTSKNDKFISISLGKGVEATISTKDIPENEAYLIGEEKKVYVTKVEKTGRGPKVFVSRSNKEIVRKLFEMNIPEISSGLIEIMGIAREAGVRSKVGVLSLSDDVDAKGACVGSAGSRIKAINAALSGEKIDIFIWRDDPVALIAEALSPAKILSVVPDEKTKKAIAITSEDQYSLAIGSRGLNAKLAVLATGWKIDIKKLSDAVEEGIEFSYNVKN
ncbi:MAG: transcription termination factor NusA [Bacilli bacterium]|jgi:N utilization substance protein A|nr:transcription termination factor NusA [Bacilli bacterium]